MFNLIVQHDPSLPEYLLTCMYGYPDFDRKQEQWNYTEQISRNHNGHWILIGDLNFHFYDDNTRISSSSDGFFNNIVNIYGLEDIGYEGKDYTWSNNNLGTGIRRSRIDMAFGNFNWNLSYPNFKVMHLTQVGSDHTPIMLLSDASVPNCWKPFKFFLTWLKDATCTSVIEKAWSIDITGSPGYQLQQLDVLQAQPPTDDNHNHILSINKELQKWHKNKIHLQKSRDQFIKDMDNNNNLNEELFMILPSIITNEDNIQLTAIPSHQEIHDTLKSMENWSAPGPEGFQAGFYKSQLNIVGDDVYYRPIGLCNTSYKIISKLIVQRLKPLMKKIISPYQVTYISGRLISDNIVIAQEIIHSMKKKRGQIGWMALKLDMSKTVDRLEWDFLIKVLKYFGFSDDLCALIYQCISTTSLSVMLNGSLCEEFQPTRGIRKGDPLSPYLFILAMEFLSRHISTAQQNNSIKGIKVDVGSPATNHLLFADDCLIFTRANITSANNLLDLLHNFSTQSGQVIINFDKSSIHFSKKNNLELVDLITQLTGVKPMSSKEKYLGSPLLLVHSKQEAFKDIEDNFMSKYSTWSCTSLTQAGRGSNLIAWHKVCIPKELGGLAFRDLEKLNLALLTKMAGNGSYTWNGIVKGIQVVQQNYFMEVNNGTTTKIWLYRWIPGMISPSVPINDFFRFYQNVEELILPETDIWNVDLLYKLFDNNIVQKIMSIFLDTLKEDTMLWMPAKDGKFSVKNTYKKLTMTTSGVQVNGRDIQNKVWRSLWKTNTAHRTKLFAWKCIRDLHNTRYKLSIYNEHIAPHCTICGGSAETIEHLIFECDHAKKIWRLSSVDIEAVHSTGSCEGIKESFSNGVLSPEAGECMAIREALTWANDKKILRIHIEADAQLVILFFI
ncbi:uncharacterized protein LOC113290763 [Papaver somniferum]|uniref:uncharacterized protein LOC113290763 n=1 Tax=Papaver somniferum TaxID=3469 RepID=UPI000E6FF109|nr:uncharacterized protein LOC113290763 [Papaver somniferum]